MPRGRNLLDQTFPSGTSSSLYRGISILNLRHAMRLELFDVRQSEAGGIVMN